MSHQSWKEVLLRRTATIKDDAIAGLIVAIVALPLALGFAIASDVEPAMGVYTAIVAGFFAALFGGSEYQVSGPTGAMVVVILGVVAQHGIPGLIVATLLAGLFLILLGLLKLGKIIEYIPAPVIIGFTAGIAVIIFFGQINNFLDIAPVYPPGAEFLEKSFVSLGHVAQANLGAVILALLTVLLLIFTKRVTKRIPGSIVAVVATVLLAVTFPSFFAVKTVGDIGVIPSSLPFPSMPAIDWNIILPLVPAALTIAALAAIESLLSAVVADGITGTRHDPNRELLGQGVANIASGLFGGMPATGAIARTATSIRNGAKSRFAALLHALFLLLFILAAAPLASLIPLATLAGILMFVAFNMVEWERILLVFTTPLSDVAVMLVTFLLTVLVDLTTAIEVGLVLAALLFMKRMSDLYSIESVEGLDPDETATFVRRFDHPDISVYTIHGPLFFGAASRFDQRVAMLPGGHKPIKIIRMKNVPVIDATGLTFLEATANKHRKQGGVVLFSTVHPDVYRIIKRAGLQKKIGEEHFFPTTRAAMIHALKHAHRLKGEPESVTDEELARYSLSLYDAEEEARVTSTHDRDPVEGILESLGVTRLRLLGRETVNAALNGTRRLLGKDAFTDLGIPYLGGPRKKDGDEAIMAGKEDAGGR